jgi:hypothetical protein
MITRRGLFSGLLALAALRPLGVFELAPVAPKVLEADFFTAVLMDHFLPAMSDSIVYSNAFLKRLPPAEHFGYEHSPRGKLIVVPMPRS